MPVGVEQGTRGGLPREVPEDVALEVGVAWGVPECPELAGDVGGGEGVDVGGVGAEVVGRAATAGDQDGGAAGGGFEGNEACAFVQAGQTEDPAGEVEGGALFGGELTEDVKVAVAA